MRARRPNRSPGACPCRGRRPTRQRRVRPRAPWGASPPRGVRGRAPRPPRAAGWSHPTPLLHIVIPAEAGIQGPGGWTQPLTLRLSKGEPGWGVGRVSPSTPLRRRAHAHGCDLTPPLHVTFLESEVVFVGTATHTGGHDWVLDSWPDEIEFDVQQVWKGNPPGIVRFRALARNNYSCCYRAPSLPPRRRAHPCLPYAGGSRFWKPLLL